MADTEGQKIDGGRPSKSAAAVPKPDFETVFKLAPCRYLIFLPDAPHFTIVEASDSYLSAMEKKREEVIGRKLFDVFPEKLENIPDTGSGKLRGSLRRVMRKGNPDTLALQKFHVPLQQGNVVRYWNLVNIPIFQENKELAFILHRMDDVTDFVELTQRTSAQEEEAVEDEQREQDKTRLEAALVAQAQHIYEVNGALRSREEQLRLIVDNVKEFAIFTFDPKGRVTTWNPGAERMFGYAESEMLGQSVDAVYTPDDVAIDEPQNERDTAMRNGMAHDERWHRRKNGKPLFIQGAVSPMYDDEGKVRGFAKIGMDFTSRKQMEEDLRETRNHLEETVGERTSALTERTAQLQGTVGELEAFSFSIAHDMRAPLRSMRSFADILMEEHADELDSEGLEYLSNIQASAARLDQLIQDVLAYSRVARAPIQMRPVDLEELIRATISHYPVLQPPETIIRIETPLLPALGHDASLMQCLSNLLGNAVKFVAPGVSPRVRIWTEEVRPGTESEPQVRLWIEDNGIGIAKEHQVQIFQIFQQVHKSYEGTGIGLAIVRKAMERMGGTVGVESEPGRGSRFWLQLPRGKE
jgi:PAS domain S-box-containing protein